MKNRISVSTEKEFAVDKQIEKEIESKIKEAVNELSTKFQRNITVDATIIVR